MLLKIGELATRTGLTVRTLHHYDNVGLLRPLARSDAGYHLYNRTDIERLHRIQALRRMERDDAPCRPRAQELCVRGTEPRPSGQRRCGNPSAKAWRITGITATCASTSHAGQIPDAGKGVCPRSVLHSLRVLRFAF